MSCRFGFVIGPVVPAPGNAWTYRSLVPVGTPRLNDQIGPEEVAREVVQDVVVLVVEAPLQRVRPEEVGDGVRDLPAFDRRLPRREEVLADREYGSASLQHVRLRFRAVCRSGLAVLGVLAAQLVEQGRREGGGQGSREGVGLDERIAAVLEGDRRAAALETDAGEVLPVVAQREVVARRGLVIHLQQEHVLVELAVVVERQGLELRDPRDRVRVRWRSRRVQDDGVGRRVALAVVVREEEELVPQEGPAERRPELGDGKGPLDAGERRA